MVETALVTLLVQGGLSTRLARKIERSLEDLVSHEIGADGIASAILRAAWLRTAEKHRQLEHVESAYDMLMQRKGACEERTGVCTAPF